MKQYSEVTPISLRLDNVYDLDELNSAYANVRYGAKVDRLFTIDAKYEANLPGLAFDYYGDMQMWRVILAFNGLVDPINDVIAGLVIALPNKSSVDAYMTKNANTVSSDTWVL